jgi:hypothetical protein
MFCYDACVTAACAMPLAQLNNGDSGWGPLAVIVFFFLSSSLISCLYGYCIANLLAVLLLLLFQHASMSEAPSPVEVTELQAELHKLQVLLDFLCFD